MKWDSKGIMEFYSFFGVSLSELSFQKSEILFLDESFKEWIQRFRKSMSKFERIRREAKQMNDKIIVDRDKIIENDPPDFLRGKIRLWSIII